MNPLKKPALPTLIMFIPGSGPWLKRFSGKYAIRRQVKPFPDLIWRRHFQPVNPYRFPHYPGLSKVEHYHHWYNRSAGSPLGNQTAGNQLRIRLQVVKQKPGAGGFPPESLRTAPPLSGLSEAAGDNLQLHNQKTQSGSGGANSKLSWPETVWIPTMGNSKLLIIFPRSIQPLQAVFQMGLAKRMDTQLPIFGKVEELFTIIPAEPPVGRKETIGGPGWEHFNRLSADTPELIVHQPLRPMLPRESLENSDKPPKFYEKTPPGISRLPDSPVEFSLWKQNAEIEKIVDRVYKMLEKQLIIEKNRRGIHTTI